MTTIVETLVVANSDGQLVALTQGSKVVPGRKLANVSGLRGSLFRHVSSAVDSVLGTGESVSGDGLAALPLSHPLTGEPIACVVAHGADQTLRKAEEVRATLAYWVWTPLREPGPPRLALSDAAADALGVDHSHRDRTVHGVVDFFTRAPSLGQTLSHLDWLYGHSASSSQTFSDTMAVFRDEGVLNVYDITEVRARESGEVVGVGALQAEPGWSPQLADALVAGELAAIDDRHIALMDIRFLTAPYVLRWLGGPPEGIGQGLSTGQRSGFHPDDRPAIAQAVIEAIQRPPHASPIERTARIRTLDGGWRSMTGRVWRVSDLVAPGIIAVEVIVASPTTPG